jgi:hypothetical protein
MSETPERLAEKLLNEGERTLAFFRAMDHDDLDVPIYSDGTQWAARQILAHFVATEDSLGRLIENILSGGPGAPENFRIDEYNEKKVAKLRDIPLEKLLQDFQALRIKSANRVALMQASELEITGRHPYLGVASLEDIIKLIYRHNQIHIRDLRRELKKA